MSAVLRPIENLRVGGEGLHGDRVAAETQAAAEARLEALESDVDAFADWLAGEVSGNHKVHVGYVPLLPIDYSDMPTHRVLAFALYPDARVSGGAMQELRARYLSANGVQ